MCGWQGRGFLSLPTYDNYDAGGYMTRHSPEHNEDYSFIYLNSCKDGATILHEDKDYHIIPQRK